MSDVHSFPPIAADGARVLILGSMPGVASLRAGRYYAHPRNAFWPLLGVLLGFDPQAPYATRCAALQAAGVAVWDVLQTCTRSGSLDARIDRRTEVANDLPGFLAAQPGIRHLFFNGAAAESCFRRHIRPKIEATALHCARLPSTSPAHAALSFADKLAAWQAVAVALALPPQRSAAGKGG